MLVSAARGLGLNGDECRYGRSWVGWLVIVTVEGALTVLSRSGRAITARCRNLPGRPMCSPANRWPQAAPIGLGTTGGGPDIPGSPQMPRFLPGSAPSTGRGDRATRRARAAAGLRRALRASAHPPLCSPWYPLLLSSGLAIRVIGRCGVIAAKRTCAVIWLTGGGGSAGGCP
jgi:hypothetical protein